MGPLEVPLGGEAASFRRVVRVSDVMVSRGSRVALSRRKRNILFPSGVKLCAQESAKQVVANHLGFFHLRGKSILCRIHSRPFPIFMVTIPQNVLCWGIFLL